jgi:hypothetical protein
MTVPGKNFDFRGYGYLLPRIKRQPWGKKQNRSREFIKVLTEWKKIANHEFYLTTNPGWHPKRLQIHIDFALTRMDDMTWFQLSSYDCPSLGLYPALFLPKIKPLTLEILEKKLGNHF